MTKYTCDTCGFETSKKTDYTRHVERKIPCGDVPTNKELANMISGIGKMKITVDISDNMADDIENISLPLVNKKEHTQLNGKLLETCVIEVIEGHGFQKSEETPLNINQNNFHHLDDGNYYIYQPFGSQMSPDIILLRVKNGFSKTLYIECKTGKNSIFWNDGFPCKNTLYVFSCRQDEKTRIFTSDDLINDIVRKCRDIYEEKKDNLNVELREMLKTEHFNPTVRGAWTQSNINKHTSSDKKIRGRFEKFLDDDFPYFKRGISLFSGAGGDTIGLEMADVKVVAFVEKDKIATSTHKHNFPHSALLGSDITKIPSNVFKQYAGRIDYLFGGFPCQSFSHGGKKDIRDPRGQLYIDFVRATEYIQPTWVIGENVKGILTRQSDDGECMADVVVEAFANIGYHMIYVTLNARAFGVPQDRQRVVFVGCKHPIDLKIPLTNNTTRTLRDILEYSLENAIPITEKHKYLVDILDNKFIKGGTSADKPTGNPPTNLVKCSEQKTENDNITYGKRGKSTYSCILDIDDVSRTLLCTYARMPRLFVPIKPEGGLKYMRPYTVLECQRIQGFPDHIEFKGTDMDAVKQIGNAVPPVMISSVVLYLNNIPKCPEQLYKNIVNEENLLELVDCEDDLEYDTKTKLLSYNDMETTIWKCEHPALVGKEKFKWDICHREKTEEYKKWLFNNGN
jgi:DNA (cytosine-5)-methyltransferase 1